VPQVKQKGQYKETLVITKRMFNTRKVLDYIKEMTGLFVQALCCLEKECFEN